MCFRDAAFIVDDGTPANERTPTDLSDDHVKLVDGLTFGTIREA